MDWPSTAQDVTTTPPPCYRIGPTELFTPDAHKKHSIHSQISLLHDLKYTMHTIITARPLRDLPVGSRLRRRHRRYRIVRPGGGTALVTPSETAFDRQDEATRRDVAA
jgi:hypothetical protein